MSLTEPSLLSRGTLQIRRESCAAMVAAFLLGEGADGVGSVRRGECIAHELSA